MKRVAIVLGLCVSLATQTRSEEVNGVRFEPAPSPSWKCGLTNEDLPGLAAEHMRQPIVAGCQDRDATAYVVIVDLSNSRSAMRAEQMAADAEEQLSSSLKIDSKSYDVISLAGGGAAAYSRLVGKGDGFTFLTGKTPMVAISANVPLLFEDTAGTARQMIVVFRIRSPLPAGAQERKARISELDRLLRDWASTAAPAHGRTISDRDFELAAYAREKRDRPTTLPSPSAPVVSDDDRITAALVAATQATPTADDLAVLEIAAKRFQGTGLGAMAETFLAEAQLRNDQRDQEKILVAALEKDAARSIELFSLFLISSIEQQDRAGMAVALRVAQQRGWSLRDLSPAAIAAVSGAVIKKTFSTDGVDRTFFAVAPSNILTLVPAGVSIPRIEDVARADGNQWRVKNRHDSRKQYVVQWNGSAGVLEQQDRSRYRFQPVDNVLDLSMLMPSHP